MIEGLTRQLLVICRQLAWGVRVRLSPGRHGDQGLTTLELTLLTLGLMAVAGLLVAALNSAVSRYITQIR